MTELYRPREAKRLQWLAAGSLLLAAGVLVLSMAACVILCRRVTTGTAGELLRQVILCSTLGGWIAMGLFFGVYRPSHAQGRHMAGILAGEKTEYEGRLTVEKETMTLPRSITVRRAALTRGEETVSLSVNARMARKLPPAGTYVRLTAVRRYITAWEVRDEADR